METVRAEPQSELRELDDNELVTRVRSGDERCVEILLDRYRNFARSKARSYFLAGSDKEDVVQEGMIGLFKAIRDYQAERRVRFRAFAEICITRQIISAVKSASRRKHLPLNRYIPLYRPVGDEDAFLVDVLADGRCEEPEDVVLNRRLADYLERDGADELSELEIQVIRRRLEGKSYQQMAAELHCRPKCVDNALQRAKRKICTRLSAWQE